MSALSILGKVDLAGKFPWATPARLSVRGAPEVQSLVLPFAHRVMAARKESIR